MKEKIILFVIGALFGAIVATGAFYIYSTINNNSCSSNTQMSSNQPPEMSNGQNSQNGQPPEKPDENNNQSTEKTNDSNTQDSN